MKGFAVLLSLLALFADPAFALPTPNPPAKLIIEGPDQRHEWGMSPFGGKVKIDFYVSGVNGFSAIQVKSVFREGGVDKSSLFTISTGTGPGFDPLFAPYEITYNKALWPSIFAVPPFGFMGQDSFRVDDQGNLVLDPADKDCTNKTWLMSIIYKYGPNAFGMYTVDVDPALTVLGGSGGDDLGNIAYTVVKGSISSIPEPATFSLLCLGLAGLFGFIRKRIRT